MLFLISLCTFVSSFMVSDTLNHVFSVSKERTSVVLLSIWLGCEVLSYFGENWITWIGLLHCAIFIASALKVYYGNYGSHEKDYIKIPLTVFIPIFGVLAFLNSLM